MAERRMFAKTIIDSDAFLDMPISAQILYFHLSMRADDDGFINNPKRIQRMVNCNDDDLKLLIAKSFIIPFENGICVIKHWKIHNYLRSDRHKDTVYQEEKKQLITKENGSYSILKNIGIPDVNQEVDERCTQDRLGKDRLGKGKQNIKQEIEEFFESVWQLYPKKEGKGQVSDTQKQKLYKIGYPLMKSYIEAYIKAKAGVEKQYLQNGSTFFNSGYIDYLEPVADKSKEPVKLNIIYREFEEK